MDGRVEAAFKQEVELTPEKLRRISLIGKSLQALGDCPTVSSDVLHLLDKLKVDVAWLVGQVKPQQPSDSLDKVVLELDKANGDLVNLREENAILSDKLSKAEDILDGVSDLLEVASYGSIVAELRTRLDLDDAVAVGFEDLLNADDFDADEASYEHFDGDE